MQISRVPLDRIAPSTLEAPAELVTSLQTGQIHPVILRFGNPMAIVDGQRRVAALRALGQEHIFAVVVRDADDAAAAVTTLAANIVRSRNPGAEADAVATLLEAGQTEADIAATTGVSRRVVTELLSLKQNLTPAAFSALRTGKLARAAALSMRKLPEATQTELIQGDTVRIKDVNAALRAQKSALLDQLETAPVAPQQARYATLAAQIEAAALSFAGDQRATLTDAAEILRAHAPAQEAA